MKLSIASGKGGTGKTTVATNLAVTLARHGQAVAYVDCDVEAPNGHLFLKPAVTRETAVGRLVPRVNPDLCRYCGACAQICQFNAIVCLPDRILVYDELCKSCGGCALACPADAITEVSHPMGVIKTGAAKQAAPSADWTILDAPPGTACPMIETVRDCDYVLLVTEPTPFGLHDLRLALDVAKTLKRPCGVVINRAQPGADETRELCAVARVPVLAEIPDAMAIAKAYSQGHLAIEAVPGLQRTFDQLVEHLRAEVQPDNVKDDLNSAGNL